MSKPLRFELVVRGLGIGGLIPLLALPAAVVFGAAEPWMRLLVLYAVIIAAFMAGTLWMRAFSARRPGLLALSTILAMLAWPAAVLPPASATALLSLVFAAQLMMDRPWAELTWPAWYRKLRLGLSASAIVLLLLTSLAGIFGEF